jgi:hypothetical protein
VIRCNATAGNRGTATAGYSGTATAGEYGILNIRYYDHNASRYRIATAYVGENGILPNVKYKLDEKDQFGWSVLDGLPVRLSGPLICPWRFKRRILPEPAAKNTRRTT